VRIHDFAIIGSGFGGSVAAMRLGEAGRDVVVLEQGHRVDPARMAAAEQEPRKFLWEPRLGMHGYFVQHLFRHVGIVGGVGVGGGSLVYGAVLLRPGPAFFRDPSWAHLGVDWERELARHYDEAERMLGLTTTPRLGSMDRYLEQAAERLGAAGSFGPTPNGIYFGEPGVAQDDPYFSGRGPRRLGCIQCGRCLTGCPHDSKNTLDRNYLYFAETAGVEVRPRHRVLRIGQALGGYEILAVDPTTRERQPPVYARRVVLAAGVVGTLELLFRCRDEHRTLPSISSTLGTRVRTNSEAIVGVLHDEAPPDLAVGAAISSHFHAESSTHITQNRFAPAYNFMRFQTTPMVDDPVPWRRALRTLAALVLKPRSTLRAWRMRDWNRHITVLTVMQQLDSELAFRFGRSLLSPLSPAMRSTVVRGNRPPTYLPIAHRAARALADVVGGTPFNFAPESLFNLSMTAHILGGACMGRDASHGVIDADHQVHGAPGVYVVDGACVTANVGVNPSLTITALAERWAAREIGSRRRRDEVADRGDCRGEVVDPPPVLERAPSSGTTTVSDPAMTG
jgi:cholesterol oxidase